MSDPADLITRFYRAFAARDSDTMAACYTADPRFSDPVFPHLSGAQVAGMWRMLCARATDLRVTFRDVAASGDTGSAHWEAWYTYSATGLPVHNVIEARFDFRDGRISRHVDQFDLYAWTRQALGLRGLLLGWAAPFQSALRGQAAKALARDMARRATG